MTEDKDAAEIGGEETDALSEADRAYFESGGEAEPEQQAEQPEGEEQQAEEGQQPRDDKGKFVPHGALHAEREEHKKTRAEMQELRDFKIRMEERWRLAEELAAKEEPKQEQPPNPDEDIFAYARWQAQKTAELEQKLAERAQAEQQQQLQQRQEQAVWSHWNASVQSFAAENKDFGNAAKWLSEFRDKQLQTLSAADPQFADVGTRTRQIEQELRSIVINAAQRGQNPAATIYQIAQGYGYKPSNVELPEQLQRVQKAQDASRSISQASGRSGADEVTPEMIANMSDTEFTAWYAKSGNAARLDRLMQG